MWQNTKPEIPQSKKQHQCQKNQFLRPRNRIKYVTDGAKSCMKSSLSLEEVLNVSTDSVY